MTHKGVKMNKYKNLLTEVKNEFKQYLKDVLDGKENRYDREQLETIIDCSLILNASTIDHQNIRHKYTISKCIFNMPKLLDILKGVDESYLNWVEVSFDDKTFEEICVAMIRGKLWEDVYDEFGFVMDTFDACDTKISYEEKIQRLKEAFETNNFAYDEADKEEIYGN